MLLFPVSTLTFRGGLAPPFSSMKHTPSPDPALMETDPAPRAAALAQGHFRPLFAALLLASAFICGYGSQLGYFWDIDEPKYAVSAYEMAQTGDFARPMFNGQPRMEKPPLAYWLMAPLARAALALDGPQGYSLLLVRLPGVLAAVLTVAATALLGRRLYGPLVGLLAALMLECSILFKFVTIILKVDVFFTCCATWLGYLLLCRMLGDRGARNMAGVCLWSVLGVLSKGPFIFLPMIGYLAALGTVPLARWLADSRGRAGSPAPADTGPGQALPGEAPPSLGQALREGWAAIWAEKGVALACAAAGCGAFFAWLGWASLVGQTNYLTGLLAELDKNTTVGAGTDVNERVGMTGFYLDTLFMVFFPWAGFLPGALAAWGRTFRQGLRANVHLLSLMLVYVLVFSLFFKLKAHRYILPVTPCLAVLAAWWLTRAVRDRNYRSWFEMCSLWTASLAAFFLVRFYRGGYLPVNLYYEQPVPDLLRDPAVLAAGAGVLALAFVLASLGQARHPVRHILVLCAGLILAMPPYLHALPKARAASDGREPAILSLAVNAALAPLAGPDVLVVNSRELQAHFPDVVFFRKDAAPWPHYSLSTEFSAREALDLLRDPGRAAEVLARSRPGSGGQPVQAYLAGRTFRRTVLLLRPHEWMELAARIEALPLLERPLLRVDQVEGLTVKWVRDQIFLVGTAGT